MIKGHDRSVCRSFSLYYVLFKFFVMASRLLTFDKNKVLSFKITVSFITTVRLGKLNSL